MYAIYKSGISESDVISSVEGLTISSRAKLALLSCFICAFTADTFIFSYYVHKW